MMSVPCIENIALVGPDHQDLAPVWELMAPKDFYAFTIPFDMPGKTKVSKHGSRLLGRVAPASRAARMSHVAVDVVILFWAVRP